MTARKLRPDEIALWQKVVETAEKLSHDPTPAAEDPIATPAVANPRKPDLSPFRIGDRSTGPSPGHRLQPALADRLSQAPVQMDRKTYTRMSRGRLVPEARIDLHGMTLDRAHPALSRFVLAAQASGKRLVLVITGKGRRQHDDGPIPVPRGILRHQVPQWLSSPPLAQAVLQIAPAHISHGGEGAYYVYLRRPR